MITAAALALACIALAAFCTHLKNQLTRQTVQTDDMENLRQEIRTVRGEDVRRRREIASLHRALEAEQSYTERLENELDACYNQLQDARARSEQAETRRINAEKDVYACRMRTDLLEKQIARLNEEQLNQAKLYQDILRDRDLQIAQLQESQPKRRPRPKKSDVLDQQVTFSDLMQDL